jgi:prepilin-type N-terminal cleavage/methylation domain-containing protein
MSARRDRAFTLIEILMVVVIIGIAAAVVVPQISQRDDLRASAASRVIMSDLLYAQNLAIMSQQPTYLVFDISGNSYMLVKSGAMTTALTNPVTQAPYTTTFGNGGNTGLESITLVSANFTGTTTPYATIGFNELGNPLVHTTAGADQTMASGAIVLQSGTYKLQISVEPFTGQLTVAQTN